jgi:hypothetical protein
MSQSLPLHVPVMDPKQFEIIRQKHDWGHRVQNGLFVPAELWVLAVFNDPSLNLLHHLLGDMRLVHVQQELDEHVLLLEMPFPP